jgi:hypothetical protein
MTKADLAATAPWVEPIHKSNYRGVEVCGLGDPTPRAWRPCRC